MTIANGLLQKAVGEIKVVCLVQESKNAERKKARKLEWHLAAVGRGLFSKTAIYKPHSGKILTDK